MRKDFKYSINQGLPGGANELKKFVKGSISVTGYKSDSPDVNNDFNIIPSNRITMQGVNFPVLGVDDLGYEQMMMPGGEYSFPGNYVTEIPQMGKGGLTQWFDEKWVDVKTGKTCGRSGKEKGSRPYPACRPSKRVNETTPKTASELSSAEKAKFKREKTSGKRISYNHKRKELGGEAGWLEQYQDGGWYTEAQWDAAVNQAALDSLPKFTENKVSNPGLSVSAPEPRGLGYSMNPSINKQRPSSSSVISQPNFAKQPRQSEKIDLTKDIKDLKDQWYTTQEWDDAMPDSTFENLVEFIDPTGITSYDDARVAYRDWKRSGTAMPSFGQGLEMFGAVPGLGKLSKLKYLANSKALKPLYKYFPWQQTLNAADTVQDEYEKKHGGWLEQYQPGGETSTFLNPDKIEPVYINYKRSPDETFVRGVGLALDKLGLPAFLKLKGDNKNSEFPIENRESVYKYKINPNEVYLGNSGTGNPEIDYKRKENAALLFEENPVVSDAYQTNRIWNYYKDYMSSPMYAEMLQGKNNRENIEINRAKNLQKIQSIPNYDNISGIGGYYKPDSNQISLNPTVNDRPFTLNEIIPHELSHSTDVVGNLIPTEDLKNIKNKLKPKSEINLSSTVDFWKKYGDNPKEGTINYFSNPTEVRARLNTIRYNLYNKGVDIFNKPIKKEDLNNLNIQNLNELKSIYKDDDILWLLNNISKTDNKTNDIKQTAKYGGWLNKYQYAGATTIYTSDPNDPRLKSYNDSLSLYNRGVKPNEITTIFNEIENDPNLRYYRKASKKELNNFPGKIKPIAATKFEMDRFMKDRSNNPNLIYGYYPIYDNRGNVVPNGIGVTEAYKKPVQPIKYADPKIVAKQQQLIDVGYNIGTADGIWGKKSQQAWDQMNTAKQSNVNTSFSTPTMPVRGMTEENADALKKQYKDEFGANFKSQDNVFNNLQKSLGRRPSVTEYNKAIQQYNSSVNNMRNGGWLNKYQEGGETSTEQNPSRIAPVNVKAEDNIFKKALRGYSKFKTGLFKTMAKNPAILNSYLNIGEVLDKTGNIISKSTGTLLPKQFIFDEFRPVDYPLNNPLLLTIDAALRVAGKNALPIKDASGNYVPGEEIYRKILGFNDSSYNYIEKSPYKPSKVKDGEKSEYIKFKNLYNPQKLINAYVKAQKTLPEGKTSTVIPSLDPYIINRESLEASGLAFSQQDPLQNFTLDKGEDEKGKYISLYDIYDFTGPANNLIYGFRKPIEIYDRMYYEKDKSGRPVYKKKYGGWLDNYQDGGELPQLNSKMDVANFYKNPLSEKYGIAQNPDSGSFEYYLKSGQSSDPVKQEVEELESQNLRKAYVSSLSEEVSRMSDVILPEVKQQQSRSRNIEKTYELERQKDFIDSQLYNQPIGPQLDPTLLPIPQIKEKRKAFTSSYEPTSFWETADLAKEILERQKLDNTYYGKFDERGDDVLNRTDIGRNKDSEMFLADYTKPNSVIIDIGSALGNNNPKLAGVSVYELTQNPLLKQKNVKVIATDIPPEVKGFEELKKKNNVYPIDYAEVPLTFNTPVRDILKTKGLENAENVYLRAANSIDLLMNPQETKEHFDYISKNLKDKNVTYLYNNVILNKPAGTTKFKKIGNLENTAFDHRRPSWKNKKSNKHYNLVDYNFKTGGQTNWLDNYK